MAIERAGVGQRLEFKTFVLSLNRCNFNPDELFGWGYERKPQSQLQVDYNVFGNAFIRANAFGYRYKFKWSLFLNDAEWTELESMYNGHLRAIGERDADYKIALYDEYMPLSEHLPRSRDLAGLLTPNVGPNNVNQIVYYPRFNIVFTKEPTIEWFYNGYYKVTIEASEVE